MDVVKSRQRVVDHGEVFTPPWLVETMLDLVEDETARIDSRFLEPACGSGNFLAPVLMRKFAAVETRYRSSEFERRHHALLALMSVYGIDLLDDNVAECRERMLGLLSEYLGSDEDDDLHRAARKVLAANIIHGNAISMKAADRYATPIVFAEWAYLGKGRFQRRDFRLDVLAQFSSFHLDAPHANPGKHAIFVPIKEYRPLAVKDLAHE
jgi:SAM-dependent methyltransferase